MLRVHRSRCQLMGLEEKYEGERVKFICSTPFSFFLFFLKSHPSIYLAYLLSVLMKDIVKPPSPSHSTIIFICQGGAAEQRKTQDKRNFSHTDERRKRANHRS